MSFRPETIGATLAGECAFSPGESRTSCEPLRGGRKGTVTSTREFRKTQPEELIRKPFVMYRGGRGDGGRSKLRGFYDKRLYVIDLRSSFRFVGAPSPFSSEVVSKRGHAFTTLRRRLSWRATINGFRAGIRLADSISNSPRAPDAHIKHRNRI